MLAHAVVVLDFPMTRSARTSASRYMLGDDLLVANSSQRFPLVLHPFVCFAWISAVPTGVVLHGKSLFMMNWGKTRRIEIQKEVKGLCPEHA